MQALILGWLQEPEITLDGLTQILQRREVSISASGLSQRFTPEAASLLQQVLERLSAEQMQIEAVDIALLRQFSAVVLEDSSSIVLPTELAEVWRGCGGSVGMSAAAIKLFGYTSGLNRNTVASQNSFGLIFVNLHRNHSSLTPRSCSQGPGGWNGYRHLAAAGPSEAPSPHG